MKAFYTLEDLQQESPFADISNQDVKPVRLAVLGHPITQSKSPQMQQAALDAAREPVQYIRIDVTPEDFNAAIKRLQELDFIGANVTVPHKQAAYSLCDETDALASATGAVNTLVFDSGKINGYNTDGPGFVRAVRDCFSVDIRDMKIVILGACGGAGSALAYACAMNKCEALALIDLQSDRLHATAIALAPYFIDEQRLGGAWPHRIFAADYKSPLFPIAIQEADLIINATALGLRPGDPSPVPAQLIAAHHLIYDLQTHRDALQDDAEAAGARTANGLTMLLHQGILSFEKWFTHKPSIMAMKKAIGL